MLFKKKGAVVGAVGLFFFFFLGLMNETFYFKRCGCLRRCSHSNYMNAKSIYLIDMYTLIIIGL